MYLFFFFFYPILHNWNSIRRQNSKNANLRLNQIHFKLINLFFFFFFFSPEERENTESDFPDVATRGSPSTAGYMKSNALNDPWPGFDDKIRNEKEIHFLLFNQWYKQILFLSLHFLSSINPINHKSMMRPHIQKKNKFSSILSQSFCWCNHKSHKQLLFFSHLFLSLFSQSIFDATTYSTNKFSFSLLFNQSSVVDANTDSTKKFSLSFSLLFNQPNHSVVDHRFKKQISINLLLMRPLIPTNKFSFSLFTFSPPIILSCWYYQRFQQTNSLSLFFSSNLQSISAVDATTDPTNELCNLTKQKQQQLFQLHFKKQIGLKKDQKKTI